MLRFHRIAAGEYCAYGSTLIYDVVKPLGKEGWRVWMYRLRRTEGVPEQGIAPSVFRGERMAHAETDTKILAYGVAQAFDALGDDYRQSEHGGKDRITTAVLKAYDGEKV